MTEYFLSCNYDRRKSFYNKAKVIEEDNTIKLLSYDTLVCEIKNGLPIVYGLYSNTTTRHIREFLKQNGFEAKDKEQILKDYSEEEESKEEQEEKFKALSNSIKMICAFGDVINKKEEDKNKWKEKMIKAGFENKGLSFPDNWEELTEEEKSKRLNKVLDVI